MGENRALLDRRDELFLLISNGESQLSTIRDEIGFTSSGLSSALTSRNDDHMEVLRKMNEFHRQELEADVILTSHYKDTANEKCVESILKRQDVELQKEKDTIQHQLLQDADKLLQQMEQQFLKGNEDAKNSSLKREEDEYLHRVQRAIITHKERMLSV